jgi:hypothetical protein
VYSWENVSNLNVVSWLSAFSSNASGKLNIFGHNCDALGMDGT